MSDRDILAATYDDTMSVYRIIWSEDADGRDIQTRQAVYAGEPCAVSFGTKKDTALPEDTARLPEVRFVVTLFHLPNVLLKAGDEVVVTRMTQTYMGRAEDSFVYPSHAETRIAVHKLA